MRFPLLPALACLPLLAFPLPASDAPSLDEVAASVRALDARLARIERALGLAPEAEAGGAMQELRAEVASLQAKVDTVAAAPAPPIAATPPAVLPAVTGKFTTSIYGYVKLDAIYDTHKTSIGDIAFFVLPKANGRADNEFNMTARESRLGLRIQAPEAAGVKLGAVIEGDFYGGGSANSPLPRLRLAYADIVGDDWSIRAGQDWETFITIIPKSLDFGYLANQGALGLRRAQLRTTRTWASPGGAKFEGRLALARTIGQDLDGGGQDDGVDSGLPTLQWNFIHERPSGAKLSFSGHYGQEHVEIAGSGLHENYDSWSAIASFAVPFSAKTSLQGSLWTGTNLDTYFGAIGQGVNRNLGCTIDASGGFVQLVLNPSPQLNVNFTAGLDDPDDACLQPGMRSANRHFSGSLFYQWTPAIRTGFQLTSLRTSYLEAPAAADLRFHSAVYFGF